MSLQMFWQNQDQHAQHNGKLRSKECRIQVLLYLEIIIGKNHTTSKLQAETVC